MLDFHYSQVKQSMGFTEQNKPIYDKKLWDDDGAWIPPMTMKSVVDLGLSVAVTIASAGTLGPVALAAINLADDLAFAVIDVAGGEKSFGESMAEFGAQSLVKVGTSLIGAGFSGTQNFDGLFTDAIGAGGFGGNVASTMSQGLTSIASSPLNAAVGAMDFSQMGTADFWSQDRFNAGLQAGLTGAFQQMATGFVGDMTEGMLAGDLTGFSQADSAAVNSVASLGGTAAQAGFEYMAFGSTSINVLNTRDFGFAPNQAHGLFALTFDKDDGIGGAITGGGHGMSISTLNEAIAGWDAFATQTRIRWYDAAGGPEVAEGYQGNTSAAVALRANYSFGDDAAREQLEGFLSGDMTLRVGAVDDRQGKTTIEDGVRVVDLLSLGLEGDVGSQLQAATVLQWEAHRDGKIGNAQQQFEETVRASFAMQGMAQVLALAYEDEFEMTSEQRELIERAQAGGQEYAAHIAGNYDFSEDNWRLIRDGNGEVALEWDGKKDLYDENGNLIREVDANGPQGALQELLGITQNEAYWLMREAGMEHAGPSWMIDANATDGTISITSEMTAGMNGEGTQFGELANAALITDSLTGFTGTLAEHDPMAIYDGLVTAGTMDLSVEYTTALDQRDSLGFFQFGQRRALNQQIEQMERDGSQFISFNQFRENNFIQDGPQRFDFPEHHAGSTVFALFGAEGNISPWPHGGLDIGLPEGTPILPFLWGPGTVVDDVEDAGGSFPTGNFVQTRTPIEYSFKGAARQENLIARYLHLSEVSVRRDLDVFADTVLGLSGNTGTIPDVRIGWHLHFDIQTDLPSPLLNLLAGAGQGPMPRWDEDYYYDPAMFLDLSQYVIHPNAGIYSQ